MNLPKPYGGEVFTTLIGHPQQSPATTVAGTKGDSMRLARKLVLLAVMAFAALAMSASSASAGPIVVTPEPGTEACSNVTKNVTGHGVTGGCHAEFQSTEHIPLVAYIPAPTVLTNCDVHIEAQIGGNGEGFVTESKLTNEPAPVSNPPCLRQGCDEANHVQLPWEIHLREAAGVESLEARFCLREGTPNDTTEGGAGSSCTVHLEVADLGGHQYEIGHHPSEEFCEPGDYPFPVSIRNAHFTSEVDTAESIEITHP